MNEWLTAISSVGFPIAACAGLGWFTYKFVNSIQAESRRREESLMQREDDLTNIIKEQGDALRQIADVLDSISERLERVENSLDKIRDEKGDE